MGVDLHLGLRFAVFNTEQLRVGLIVELPIDANWTGDFGWQGKGAC